MCKEKLIVKLIQIRKEEIQFDANASLLLEREEILLFQFVELEKENEDIALLLDTLTKLRNFGI